MNYFLSSASQLGWRVRQHGRVEGRHTLQASKPRSSCSRWRSALIGKRCRPAAPPSLQPLQCLVVGCRKRNRCLQPRSFCLTLLDHAATLTDYQHEPLRIMSCNKHRSDMHIPSQRGHLPHTLHGRMGKNKLQASAQSARAVLELGQFEVLQCHGEHSIIAQVNALEKRLFSKSFALTGEHAGTLMTSSKTTSEKCA